MSIRGIRDALVRVARQHSRVTHEAEDLAHDLVVSALRRGISCESEAFLRSVRGAAWRHGTFLARTAARRQTREACVVGEITDPLSDDVEPTPWSTLSTPLRTTLLLLALGLEKAELRHALGVSDAALRKRFQALRERAPLSRPTLVLRPRSPAEVRLRRSQVELVPRLATHVDATARVLATADPDGHGLIVIEALTSGHPTATSDARALSSRQKGSPCSTPTSETSRSFSS